jgi:hypothetical protein
VVIRQFLRAAEIPLRFPCIVYVIPILPLDQILNRVVDSFTVQYCFHIINIGVVFGLEFGIEGNRRIASCGFKKGYVEFRV